MSWLKSVCLLFLATEMLTRSVAPAGCYWDQRVIVAPDGQTLVAFLWTYDREEARYYDMHRRVSRDGGAVPQHPRHPYTHRMITCLVES